MSRSSRSARRRCGGERGAGARALRVLDRRGAAARSSATAASSSTARSRGSPTRGAAWSSTCGRRGAASASATRSARTRCRTRATTPSRRTRRSGSPPTCAATSSPPAILRDLGVALGRADDEQPDKLRRPRAGRRDGRRARARTGCGTQRAQPRLSGGQSAPSSATTPSSTRTPWPSIVERRYGSARQGQDPVFGKDIVALGYVKDCAVDGDEVARRARAADAGVSAPRAARSADRATRRKAVGASDVTVEVRRGHDARSGRRERQAAAGRRRTSSRSPPARAASASRRSRSTSRSRSRAHGANVGLLDADVFGPSIPTMLGAPEVPPGSRSGTKITPAMHYGHQGHLGRLLRRARRRGGVARADGPQAPAAVPRGRRLGRPRLPGRAICRPAPATRSSRCRSSSRSPAR